LVTVIHDTLGTAVHAHPPGSVTLVLKLAPPAATLWAVGLSVASHVAPAWVMTKGWLATVIVADRELLFGLAWTEYPTLPLPLPDVDVLNVIHDAGLDALQAHPDPAVTLTFPEPAAAVTDALAGEML
jgi:hypothetical protein